MSHVHTNAVSIFLVGEEAIPCLEIHEYLHQGCELDQFLSEFKFEVTRHLQVRVQRFLFSEFEFIYSIMHFKHKINGKVNKMNNKHIIREMAKPVGLKHAVP